MPSWKLKFVSNILYMIVESKFINLRVCRVNVGVLGDTLGRIVEMLTCRSVDLCCMQKKLYLEESQLEWCEYSKSWSG